MDDEIEYPVTRDERANQKRLGPMVFPRVVKTTEQQSPDDAHEEAMTPGVVHEIKRCEHSATGNDGDAFDTHQNENRPEEIRPLSRYNQRAEGDRGGQPSGTEREGEMTEDHTVKA